MPFLLGQICRCPPRGIRLKDADGHGTGQMPWRPPLNNFQSMGFTAASSTFLENVERYRMATLG